MASQSLAVQQKRKITYLLAVISQAQCVLVACSEQATDSRAPAAVIAKHLQALAALRAQCDLSSGCITALLTPPPAADLSSASIRLAKPLENWRLLNLSLDC